MVKLNDNILYFDIETSLNLAGVFQTGKQRVGHDQLLSYYKGKDVRTKMICVSYVFNDDKKIKHLVWDMKQNDKKLLTEFVKITEKADTIVGQNSDHFDVRTLNARLAYHRLSPIPVTLLEDTYKQCRQAFRLPSYKLDYLLDYFGIGRKKHIGGMDAWKAVSFNNDRVKLAEMVDYCDYDVEGMRELHQIIRPYVKTKRNFQKVYDDAKVCKSCGSHKIQYKGYLLTAAVKYRRIQCQDCGKWDQVKPALKNGEKV